MKTKITLKQLHIFYEIAKTGTTTGAGESIALSQSAISAALKELENNLETVLFDRAGKKLVLNDKGRHLMPLAQHVLDSAAQIENQFKEMVRTGQFNTRICIGSSSVIGSHLLPNILSDFYQERPEQNIEVKIRNSRNIMKLVAQYEVDFGLIEEPCHHSDLISTPWLEDEMIIVASPKHPLAQLKQVSIEQLSQARWIMREAESGIRDETERLLLPHLNRLQYINEMGSFGLMKRSVATGVGISLLSRFVVMDMLQNKSLVELSTTLPRFSRRFFLIVHHKKLLSQNLKYFFEFCQKYQNQP
ncbi:LysR family transcriptional regulator [Neisseria sp. Ec49-e6-T10]|uniref:LysR family transcriptional regulator n=1 Tax=Neisseria sp. Ec49-e6-T10 TaxID=3140744 RepID=UPI003EBC6385